jgi:TolB-like protein/class 3 adenylate cyclase
MERRLAAVVIADVVGYSKLIREDETGTLARFQTLQTRIFQPRIREFDGRLVKTMGDSYLLEFPSAVAAVECCMAIQRDLQAHEATTPEDRRIRFRVGINVGDIVVDNDDIHGDGVNVAARLESMAEPGGILISNTVYDQVRDKLAIGFEAKGEAKVKNIARPIPVFAVSPNDKGHAAPTSTQKRRSSKFLVTAMAVLLVSIGIGGFGWWSQRPDFKPANLELFAYSLPDKPSIAVLPFDNMDDGQSEDSFTDGLTEDLITDLSKISGLFVIARNSTFTYKGRPVKVTKVAEELGVRYVLEGSARRSGNKVRINAQLIDAVSGNHLWAQRYDRDLKDVFTIQDEITRKIVTTLKIKLTGSEHERLSLKHSRDIDAVAAYLKGWTELEQFTKVSFEKARQQFELAIKLDPGFAGGYMGMSYYYWLPLANGWTDDAETAMKKGFEYARKAEATDSSLAIGLAALGELYRFSREYEKALEYAERAVALEPNFPEAHIKHSAALTSIGRPEDALKVFEKIVRLDPRLPEWQNFHWGFAYFGAGQYSNAVKKLEKFRKRYGFIWGGVPMLLSSYGHLGELEKAKTLLADYLKKRPSYSVSLQEKAGFVFKRSSDFERLLDGLRKAGVPEHPTGAKKPSIAVLPFANLTGDAKQDFFSDGITEEIITALSRYTNLFVIARNSTAKYKGKAVDVRDVGAEFNVAHVLEGSVRRSASTVRVTAQLLDAMTGAHIWADNFERQLTPKSIFAVQDDISTKVATIIGESGGVLITRASTRSAARKPPATLSAYECVLVAYEFYRVFLAALHTRARDCLERTVQSEPNYSDAWAELAFIYLFEWHSDMNPRPNPLNRALDAARRAYELAPLSSSANRALANVHFFNHDLPAFRIYGDKAISLNPNDVFVLANIGQYIAYSGDWETGVALTRKAISRNPSSIPFWWRYTISKSHYNRGEYKKALAEAKKTKLPEYWITQLQYAYINGSMGQNREAAAAVKRLRELYPDADMNTAVDLYRKFNFEQKYIDRMVAGLRIAGLPEN